MPTQIIPTDKDRKIESCEHEPDWQAIHITHDGGETYVDVDCRWCELSGCIGTSKTLAHDITW